MNIGAQHPGTDYFEGLMDDVSLPPSNLFFSIHPHWNILWNGLLFVFRFTSMRGPSPRMRLKLCMDCEDWKAWRDQCRRPWTFTPWIIRIKWTGDLCSVMCNGYHVLDAISPVLWFFLLIILVFWVTLCAALLWLLLVGSIQKTMSVIYSAFVHVRYIIERCHVWKIRMCRDINNHWQEGICRKFYN